MHDSHAKKFKSPKCTSVPMKGARISNGKLFSDFHESFFENVFKIAVFLAINLQSLANLQFSESTYKI